MEEERHFRGSDIKLISMDLMLKQIPPSVCPHHPSSNCRFQCLGATSQILQIHTSHETSCNQGLDWSKLLDVGEILFSFLKASVIKSLLQMQRQELLAGFRGGTTG